MRAFGLRSATVAAVLVLARPVLPAGPSPASAQGVAAPAAPRGDAAAITLRARAFRPGELLVVDIAVARATAVHVEVFDRTIGAFPVGEGKWRALAGIDLDQAPGSYRVSAQAAAGSAAVHASHELVVERRVFPTRTLRVPPDFVNPPPDVLARIEREQIFVRQVYEQSAPVRRWDRPFVRPVPHAANSRFGTRSIFNGERRAPHAGTDFLSPAGTPIHAPNGGRVVCARDLFFTGKTVIIDHGLGVFSMLAHLSRLDVAEGEDVAARQQLGLVGATGRVTGPHLHWALSVSGARVDPLSVLTLIGEPGSATRPPAK